MYGTCSPPKTEQTLEILDKCPTTSMLLITATVYWSIALVGSLTQLRVSSTWEDVNKHTNIPVFDVESCVTHKHLTRQSLHGDRYIGYTSCILHHSTSKSIFDHEQNCSIVYKLYIYWTRGFFRTGIHTLLGISTHLVRHDRFKDHDSCIKCCKNEKYRSGQNTWQTTDQSRQ